MPIYPTDDGYVISSRGTWLPGCYDSEATARYAFQFSEAVLQALQSEANKRGKRVISKDDLKAARKNMPRNGWMSPGKSSNG